MRRRARHSCSPTTGYIWSDGRPSSEISRAVNWQLGTPDSWMLEIVLRQFARGPRVDLRPPLLRVTSLARNGRLSWDDTTEPSSESHILTEATQGPAASRARAGGVVNDVLARQVCRQS